MFAGLSSFKEIMNALVIVIVLMAVSFGFGYCKGYESGKSESNPPVDEK